MNTNIIEETVDMTLAGYVKSKVTNRLGRLKLVGSTTILKALFLC